MRRPVPCYVGSALFWLFTVGVLLPWTGHTAGDFLASVFYAVPLGWIAVRLWNDAEAASHILLAMGICCGCIAALYAALRLCFGSQLHFGF